MTTMNISVTDELRAFVESQVASGAYVSTSEYIREVLRRERQRTELRQLLLDGGASPVAGLADEAFFAELRRNAATG